MNRSPVPDRRHRTLFTSLTLTLTLLVAAGLPGANADVTTRRVPAEFPTIQQALDASTFGDIVLVAPGTYPENLVLDAQHDGVQLLSEAGPLVTTIDGGHLDRVADCSDLGPQTLIEGFTMANGRVEPFSGHSIGGGLRLLRAHLRIVNNIVRNNFAEAAGGLYADWSSPTLIGNEIRENESLASGGGIYLDHFSDAHIEGNSISHNTCGHHGGGLSIWEGSSPHLIDNTIAFNDATRDGGGLLITRGSSPRLVGNLIADNRCGNTGGGLEISLDSSPELSENTIRDNHAGAGGELYIDSATPTLIDNLIRDNAALASGGGVYCDHSADAHLEGNVIVHNTSGHFGGGLSIWESSSPEVIGNTIVANEAVQGGGGIYVTRGSNPHMVKSIIAFNPVGSGIRLADPSATISLACNDVWGNAPLNYSGLPDATGINHNISPDPLFCDAGAGDFRLRQDSPCTAANSPIPCGQIGALGIGCGPVATEATTWGSLKARFESREKQD